MFLSVWKSSHPNGCEVLSAHDRDWPSPQVRDTEILSSSLKGVAHSPTRQLGGSEGKGVCKTLVLSAQ